MRHQQGRQRRAIDHYKAPCRGGAHASEARLDSGARCASIAWRCPTAFASGLASTGSACPAECPLPISRLAPMSPAQPCAVGLGQVRYHVRIAAARLPRQPGCRDPVARSRPGVRRQVRRPRSPWRLTWPATIAWPRPRPVGHRRRIRLKNRPIVSGLPGISKVVTGQSQMQIQLWRFPCPSTRTRPLPSPGP